MCPLSLCFYYGPVRGKEKRKWKWRPEKGTSGTRHFLKELTTGPGMREAPLSLHPAQSTEIDSGGMTRESEFQDLSFSLFLFQSGPINTKGWPSN